MQRVFCGSRIQKMDSVKFHNMKNVSFPRISSGHAGHPTRFWWVSNLGSDSKVVGQGGPFFQVKDLVKNGEVSTLQIKRRALSGIELDTFLKICWEAGFPGWSSSNGFTAPFAVTGWRWLRLWQLLWTRRCRETWRNWWNSWVYIGKLGKKTTHLREELWDWLALGTLAPSRAGHEWKPPTDLVLPGAETGWVLHCFPGKQGDGCLELTNFLSLQAWWFWTM